MTIKKLAIELCKREGKKKQVDIAQMAETLGHLSDILFKEYTDAKLDVDIKATQFSDVVLFNNGKRRSKGKKKK